MPRPIEIPSSFEVSFDEIRILVRLGYGCRWASAPPRTRSLIRDGIRVAAGLIEPRCLAAELVRDEIPDHPVFRNAEKAAVCLCTIGPRLEEAQAGLMSEGDALRALILDGLGSDAIAAVSRAAEAYLARWGRDAGLWPSKAFSPGFRGWDVSGQRLIFSVLPAGQIGVRINDSFMMEPMKSRSFRINYYADRTMTSRRIKD
jgi:hypothetical protein